MRRTGFTDLELGKLREAQQESDDLVRLENAAMAAVRGLFPDERGEFTRKGKPDLELARSLLYGQEYHASKAKVMGPITEFMDMKAVLSGTQPLDISHNFYAILDFRKHHHPMHLILRSGIQHGNGFFRF